MPLHVVSVVIATQSVNDMRGDAGASRTITRRLVRTVESKKVCRY